MSKYRALFIEESREHLSELSRLLVAVEASSEPAPLIDEIFRHAHSLKGMAGSMGYDPITALAHRMEDVVDVFRKQGIPIGKDTVDRLLKVVDALSQQIECIAEERALEANYDLVRELSALAQSGGRARAEPAPAAPAAGSHAAAVPPGKAGAPGEGAPAPASTAVKAGATVAAATATPAAATAGGTGNGKPAVAKGRGESKLVRVRIRDASSAPAVRAFLVHRRLSELGPVLESRPSLDQLRLGQLPFHQVEFIVAAGLDEDTARSVLTNLPDVEAVSFDAVEPAEAVGRSVAKPAAAEVDAVKSVSTVRVRTEVLDGLINSVGELFIARERLQSLLSDVARPDVRAALDGLSGRIREIHNQVMAVRMMPMRTLTDRYPRLVRDLARSLKKDIELEVTGGDIELDRAILDSLDAVFIHTLRNAVDHGIEDPLERADHNKPASGKIIISAARDRDMVLVSVEDDGHGLDPEKLRRAAVDKGLLSLREAEALSARECYFLVCQPGFSTKAEVSDVSGRGVGMDAVRSKIESLGGTLDIESEVGRGTRFVFRLPLTLAIVPVLLVEAGHWLFAIPVAKVVAVREKGEDVIPQAGGRFYLSFQHALVPVTELGEVLKLQMASDLRFEQVVVIEDGRDLSGLAVSRIVGYHEVVVKPLGDPLDRLEWFSGAAILGDGQPILILDVPRALRQKVAV